MIVIHIPFICLQMFNLVTLNQIKLMNYEMKLIVSQLSQITGKEGNSTFITEIPGWWSFSGLTWPSVSLFKFENWLILWSVISRSHKIWCKEGCWTFYTPVWYYLGSEVLQWNMLQKWGTIYLKLAHRISSEVFWYFNHLTFKTDASETPFWGRRTCKMLSNQCLLSC